MAKSEYLVLDGKCRKVAGMVQASTSPNGLGGHGQVAHRVLQSLAGEPASPDIETCVAYLKKVHAKGFIVIRMHDFHGKHAVQVAEDGSIKHVPINRCLEDAAE